MEKTINNYKTEALLLKYLREHKSCYRCQSPLLLNKWKIPTFSAISALCRRLIILYSINVTCIFGENRRWTHFKWLNISVIQKTIWTSNDLSNLVFYSFRFDNIFARLGNCQWPICYFLCYKLLEELLDHERSSTSFSEKKTWRCMDTS